MVFGLLVSLDLCSRYVIPCVKHFGFVSWSLMTLLKKLIIFPWTESKAFNKKSGTLSIPCDLNLCDFQRAFFRSFGIISSHTCSFNPSHVSLPFWSIQNFHHNLSLSTKYFVRNFLFCPKWEVSQFRVSLLFNYFKDVVFSVEFSSDS